MHALKDLKGLGSLFWLDPAHNRLHWHHQPPPAKRRHPLGFLRDHMSRSRKIGGCSQVHNRRGQPKGRRKRMDHCLHVFHSTLQLFIVCIGNADSLCDRLCHWERRDAKQCDIFPQNWRKG